jgi:hypothetical protein
VTRVLTTFAALVVVGSVAVACSYSMDSPERTLALPNDANGPRLVRRCHGLDDCRSPEKGDLVRPGESFEFDIYADEERAYVVANADGETFGCIKVFIADGRRYPESLSDLRRCPRGTPKATEE